MIADELIFLLVYYSGRLFFYDINGILSGQRAARGETVRRLIWGLAAFIPAASAGEAAVLFIMNALLVSADSYITFKNPARRKYFFLFGTGLTLTAAAWLAGIAANAAHFLHNPLSAWLNCQLSAATPIKGGVQRLAVISLGYLLALKEGTIFIRFILNQISAVPVNKADRKDRDLAEYERGKIIGLLERTFIYFLIIFNQIGAIAVIIALKSLARFNELNDKNFAEYFLIGSLLSLFTATLPAVLVRFILNM